MEEIRDKFGNILLDTEKEVAEKLKSNEREVCPLCNDENILYGSLELDGSCAYYDCTCMECGATWKEWYHLEFTCNDSIKEG